jgi:ectoine hydroxylase-related dioxygenase (phytanoyl-CoA dioxygenase family)
MSVPEGQRRQLEEDGFVVLPGFMGDDLLAELRQAIESLFIQEGEQAGTEFKQEPGCRRLANLVDKGEVFRRVIALPALLDHVACVLGPDFKLSSLNARSVNPHSERSQPLHADMGAVADEFGYWVCNTVWMLDDFTADNGALRLVPGSHRLRRLPQEVLADPLAPHPQEVVLTGRAGSVVVLNAHVWHGGLANRTDRPRTALHAFYARRDRPQQQHQKQLVRPEVQRELSAELRRLLALDDPLNDRLSTEAAVRSGFLK